MFRSNRGFECQPKYTHTLQPMFRNPFYENNSEKSLHTKVLVAKLCIKYRNNSLEPNNSVMEKWIMINLIDDIPRLVVIKNLKA